MKACKGKGKGCRGVLIELTPKPKEKPIKMAA